MSITRKNCSKELQRKVASGSFQLVYISPELLLDNRRWRTTLSNSLYAKCLKGFIVDEAHTVVKW